MMKTVFLYLLVLVLGYSSCQSPVESRPRGDLADVQDTDMEASGPSKTKDVRLEAKDAKFEFMGSRGSEEAPKQHGEIMKNEAPKKPQERDVNTKEFTHAISKETPYYLAGPQQGTPPNGYFAVGTKLRVHSDAIGNYSLVETSEGIKAYVSASDIKQIQ